MALRMMLPPLLFAIAIGLLFPSLASAFRSDQFYQRESHIYDDWGISRTTALAPDGFLGLTAKEFNPVITRESLGNNIDIAWRLGKEFVRKYPDKNQRAEKIFYFVRDRVAYVSDADQFGRSEFARNADEVADEIAEKGQALGDCEDSAILLAVMYKAAGYRSAMVLMPGHIATLVYLPEYRKAPRKMTLGGEKGWVWGEATGATNPFGWVPEALVKGEMIAREVRTVQLDHQENRPEAVTVEGESPARHSGSTSITGFITLVGTIGLLGALAGGRSGARRIRM